MNDLNELVRSVVENTGASLAAFRPELALCAAILAALAAKVILPNWRTSGLYVTLLGLAAAIWFAWPCPGHCGPAALFTGAIVADSFTAVLRGLLLVFAILFTVFTQAAGAADQDDMTEFYVLMLGALVGMCLMISANHILIVLLGMEMASLPCYVLAGMQRNRPKSSEAAMKYAVFGAGAAGVMLFGMSLLVGALGSAHLPTMSVRLASLIHDGAQSSQSAALILGGLLLMVGVGFKLSAVPFHFWAPDVFEGATAEVAAFLSVASKAAALGLLVRLAAAFSFPAVSTAPLDPAIALAALAPVRHYIAAMIGVLAAITCTFGNLAAYGQTNMKRLLAYSTIAHAGYMMMPVAAAVSLLGTDVEAARYAVSSLVVYLGIYLFMNLSAFAIVAFLRNALGSEEIADYAGLIRRSPGLTVCMAIVMFSLVGLPPLAGFSAKFAAFYAVVQAKLWALLLIGVLNTLLSLFYYLRVVKVMIFSPEPLYRDAPRIPLASAAGLCCVALCVPVVVLFFATSGLLHLSAMAASTLFQVVP